MRNRSVLIIPNMHVLALRNLQLEYNIVFLPDDKVNAAVLLYVSSCNSKAHLSYKLIVRSYLIETSKFENSLIAPNWTLVYSQNSELSKSQIIKIPQMDRRLERK